MRNETITKGTEIKTIAGRMVAKSYNGSMVYLDEYETSEDGEAEKVRERRLTLAEIGDTMKEVDGQNHKVTWEEPEDEREKIKIFENYGVLSAEKQTVYTYGTEHSMATCSSEIEVYIPDGFKICENEWGHKLVETPDGQTHDINDLLAKGDRPRFVYYDKDCKKRSAILEEV